MWQRIQTLYLLLSTGLVAALFFCDKAAVIDAGGAEPIRFTSYLPYTILLVIITILNLLSLTGYRIRVFQMRTAVFSAIITLALQVWLAVDYFVTSPDNVRFYVTALIPLASVILDLLAARNIYADELLVRSASRLRSAKRRQNTKH